MKNYVVHATVTISCYTHVEAESEDEALAIASDREMAGLVSALDTLLPARDAQDAYALVLAMGCEHWDGAVAKATETARKAAKDGEQPRHHGFPSAKTRALVVDHYRQAARVEEMRLAREYLARTLGTAVAA